VEYKRLRGLDRWMLHKLAVLNTDVQNSYNNFEFYKVFQLIHNFCSVELSSFYLDVAKDILYTSKKDSIERRSIQTAMYAAMDLIIKITAPIIPFTTEEAWGYIPETTKNSIHLESIPVIKKENINQELDLVWSKVLTLREQASKQIEEKRKNKEIGHSLDVDLDMVLPEDIYDVVAKLDMDLSQIFIVSNVKITKGQELKIEVRKSEFKKCARCWQYKEDVGKIKECEDLCKRCKDAIN